jgi:hypothetical protein
VFKNLTNSITSRNNVSCHSVNRRQIDGVLVRGAYSVHVFMSRRMGEASNVAGMEDTWRNRCCVLLQISHTYETTMPSWSMTNQALGLTMAVSREDTSASYRPLSSTSTYSKSLIWSNCGGGQSNYLRKGNPITQTKLRIQINRNCNHTNIPYENNSPSLWS